MKRMTPATRLLLDTLEDKYRYFAKRNMLANDGSFYCLDKYLMEELGIADNTIKRARIFLKGAREINYVIGKHKGAPIRYWIMPKGAKLEPKEANLVVKGSQNSSLNNKVLIRNEIKNMPDISFSFTEDEKEGIRAYAKSYGFDETSNFLVSKGCDPESIREILEGAELCKK